MDSSGPTIDAPSGKDAGSGGDVLASDVTTKDAALDGMAVIDAGSEGIVDTTRPTIVGTSPADTATGIPVVTMLSVDFSEAMNPGTVALSLQPAVQLGAPVWSGTNASVAFTPSASLAPSTVYKVTVTGSDVAGNALTGVATFSFTTQAAPDTTPPSIVSTTPADGAMSVATTTGISITFSEAMDEGSVLVTAVPDIMLGTPTFNAQKTQVSFTPTAPLTTSTTYIISVSGQDPAKNALAGPTQFKFTTAKPPDNTPPTVVSITPANNATGVASNSSIVITFSEAMDTAATGVAIAISPATVCTGGWTWNATGNTATCVPSAPLAYSTTYNVNVNTAAKDLAGNALAVAFASSFVTGAMPDTTPPTIVGVNPPNAATGVARNTTISVTFSEAMDVASAQAAFSVVQPAGVIGTFSWAAGNQTMTFSPSTSFAYGDVVRFQVSTAAMDAAGNAKQVTDSFAFTVIRSTTVNFPCVNTLDGYVNSLGSAFPANGFIVAGDSGAGGTQRGFAGFDLSALPTTTTAITAAYLYAYQYSVAGTPYGATTLGDLQWRHSDFGPTLDATDYATPVLGHAFASGTLSATAVIEWKSASVVFSVRDDWANRATRNSRSEYVLRFPTDLINNGVADYAYLYSCEASAAFRPYLAVTYEYP